MDYWTPINEPLVVATNGYANVPGVFGGFFPPGAFSFTGAIRAVLNLERGNRAAYDAIKRWDRTDADRDRRRSRVGLVQNLVAFEPADPSSASDRRGTEHADYLFNRLFINAAVRGEVDANGDGQIGPGEAGRHGRKADFVGVNYYFRGRVTGLPTSLSKSIPVLDFLPQTDYRTPQKPDAPPCPTECSEFGNEIYPEGLRGALRTAGSYGLPVIITENGLADADDNQRTSHLLRHLRVTRQAMTDRLARVQGYLHWSLYDNFEWSAGYYPRFGLFRVEPDLQARRATQRERVRTDRAHQPAALGDPLQHVGVHVEVRVDGRHVVVLLERVDQPHQPLGVVLPRPESGCWAAWPAPPSRARTPAPSSASRTAVNSDGVVTISNTSSSSETSSAPASMAGSRSSSEWRGGIDHQLALLLEDPGDRPRLAQRAAAGGEGVAHLGPRAVAVVGERLDEHGHPARAVALVGHRLDGLGVLVGAGSLRDRALDVVLGHPRVLGLLDGQCERRVALDVSPTLPGGHLDRPRELGEGSPALGVDRLLLVLDRGPFGVTGHGDPV